MDSIRVSSASTRWMTLLAAVAVAAAQDFDFGSDGSADGALGDRASVLTLSGSGTTNPSKLLWRVFNTMEDQAGSPIRLSYRAVGSGVGIKEFVGDASSGFLPYSDFGSADIPLPSTEYSALSQRGMTSLQIPFVLGAVSFFHTVKAGPGGLKLSPCVLAKIFRRQITTWDHPDIIAENPELSVDPNAPITVVRRSDGSSSTSGITDYLNKACPSVWGVDLVGKTIDWPEGTVSAQGSGGVTTAIESTALGITYLSSGHGHSAGLSEVAIQNRDGTYLTWTEANVGDALLQAQNLPDDYTADLSQVDLVHLGGPRTWPITQLSYIFIRQDQTQKPQTGALLKTVAQILFSKKVQEGLFPQFGFTGLPQEKIDVALANIAKIRLSPDAIEWRAEEDTVAYSGQGPNIISSKRKSWSTEQLLYVSSQVDSMSALLDQNLGRAVHGSGTTNPSALLWHVMETLQKRAQINLDLTYRAVGSSTGQKEFIGADNGYAPYNDFGAGDLPLSAAQYNELIAAGHTVIQIPFLIGAVGIFHDIPAEIVGESGLQMSACTLAKIFQRDITDWSHPDILQENPQMVGKVSASDRITVLHRELGSSSTAGFTNYLQKACPQVWRLGAGKKLDTWPQDTFGVQGSQEMVSGIAGTPFSIGYVDAGYGWSNNLQEIALINKDGTAVTTRNANVPEAATIAVRDGMIPSSSTADFSGVDLLNQGGDRTWPITLFSYLYIRQDLQHLGHSASVLKALVEFLHKDEVYELFPMFGFFPPPPEVRDINMRGIQELILPAGSETWEFEDPNETVVGGGAGRFVFSGKRLSFSSYQAKHMANQLSSRLEAVEAAQGLPVGGSGTATSSPAQKNPVIFQQLEDLKQQNAQLQLLAITAIILAGFSILLAAILAFIVFTRTSASVPCADPNPHVAMKEVEITTSMTSDQIAVEVENSAGDTRN